MLLANHVLKVHPKGAYQDNQEIFILKKVELRQEDEFFQRNFHLVREMFHVVGSVKKSDFSSLEHEFKTIMQK